MLKIIRMSTALLLFGLALYALISEDFRGNSYISLLMGLLMVIMGAEEFKKGRKSQAYLLLAVAGFSFFVSVQGFMLK